MVLRIKELRQKKGLTQCALSRLSGVPREQINRYESGRAIPEIGTVQKLAKALECSLDELVTDAQ